MNNAALWMKPETRNQKPETRNQKLISAFPRLGVKRSMLALACAGLFAATASAGEAAAPMSSPDTNPYITFSSSLKFYVWPQKSSDGTRDIRPATFCLLDASRQSRVNGRGKRLLARRRFTGKLFAPPPLGEGRGEGCGFHPH